MILHGKDLIVSIDGNANMASKSCTLSVSAKSMVKTSPTSGDWEEVLSGKKSWSLTTNHLVKEATAQSFDPEGLASNLTTGTATSCFCSKSGLVLVPKSAFIKLLNIIFNFNWLVSGGTSNFFLYQKLEFKPI